MDQHHIDIGRDGGELGRRGAIDDLDARSDAVVHQGPWEIGRRLLGGQIEHLAVQDFLAGGDQLGQG